MEVKTENLIKEIEKMQKDIRALELDKRIVIDFIKEYELEDDFNDYLTEKDYFEQLEDIYCFLDLG